MRLLEDYLTNDSLADDVGALCDPKLDFERDRSLVNDLTMNVVVKYLGAYLGLKTDVPSALKSQIRVRIDESKPKDPGLYFLMTHCYGADVKGDHGSVHEFPLRCLADVRSTAALVKETGFGSGLQGGGRFVGVDLGTGTGILLVGMAIAARRQGFKEFFCAGAEIRELAVKNARKALKAALGNSHCVEHLDLMKEGNLEAFLKKFPPRYWISETISDTTPPLDISSPDLGRPDLHTSYRAELEKADDPFVELLAKTLVLIPDFAKQVAAGKAAMFPNLLGGGYKPMNGKSTLSLKTGSKTPILLNEVGKEFEDYEEVDDRCRRWS